MDLYKFKWKTRYRWDKVTAVFKLCKYNIILKLGKEGDDGFYYHQQRELMRYIIHSDVEWEYLAEHGLLPEEPEPEPESELEPELEPGLVRKLDYMDMFYKGAEMGSQDRGPSVVCGEITYMVEEMKEYEDHISLKVLRTENFEDVTYEFDFPYNAEDRYFDFLMEDLSVRFDIQKLRLIIPSETE